MGRMAGETLAAHSLEVIRAGQDAGGAFIAGPTFSQYRFAWLRDGSFIAESLDMVGDSGRAARFHDWVAGVVLASAGGVERAIVAGRAGRVPARSDYLHCRYSTEGRPLDDDWAAFQLDGPGIWAWSLAHHVSLGGTLTEPRRRALELVVRYLAALWQVPCADAWEEHADRVHTGTLAAVLAGLRAAEGLAPDVAARRDVRAAVEGLERRLLAGDGSWTKWDGSTAVDAGLLWLAVPYRLVPPEHPRFAATLARIETELVSVDGGVHRYADDTYYGGGEWPLLTAALGRVLLLRGAPGDHARAAAALAWIEAQAGPDGTLPEQVPTRALHPERIAEWRGRWGESARPLLWSHAAYLALRVELMRAAHPHEVTGAGRARRRRPALR